MAKTMLKDERLKEIMLSINKNGSITVQNLSRKLNVTPETIRRDLETLENQNKLKRVYGGAISIFENIQEFDAHTRQTININEKINLASIAADFVKEGALVALDDSTTNIEIAKTLAKQFTDLTCITNSLAIAQIFATNPKLKILLASGRLDNKDLYTYGQAAIDFIKMYHPDIFFMSASGISIENGIMDYGFDQFDIKMAMKESSSRVFCVADNTKFGKTATIRVCNFDEVDGIITDKDLDKSWMENLTELGVNLFFP
ncbi:DeoR/GlpR family DNA-binding transcription regulator [Lagierella sp.]|uniref:DeoR/GlpR family DNA-binding transcription regulator n=1 Tax=Lagierella sp. TaxID=2849657 RepID=UPI00260243C5|nr:DeoR/GlpR family DNA-binding transcription regulator [Lagierella sp.]